MSKRLLTILCAVLFSLSLKGQRQFQYIRVISTGEEKITDAILKAEAAGVCFFSSEEGVISVLSDSLYSYQDIVVSAPRHNLKLIGSLPRIKDTLEITLDPYSKPEFTEERRLKGFAKIAPFFLLHKKQNGTAQGEILQKRRAYLTDIPINVKGVSGRVVPGENDIGKVVGALRWSEVDYTSEQMFQEQVLARIDSGLFRDLGNFSSLELVWSTYREEFTLRPFSNLSYPVPIRQKNVLDYQYYLIDSVQYGDRKFYRIDVLPVRARTSLFHGTVWLDSQTNFVVETHLGLLPENQVNFVDSINMHFYDNRLNGPVKGASQHTEIWINLLGYKLKFDVNTVVLKDSAAKDSNRYPDKFRVIETSSSSSIDSLDYFSSVINGNTSVLDKLNNTSTITSRNYKVKSILDEKVDFARAFFLTGANYYLNKGYIELVPLGLSLGFNTVEGWYINYRAHYHLVKNRSKLRFTPYLRYGFASRRLLPRAKLEYEFNPESPIRFVAEGGVKYQQFNVLEPINPLVNSFYSLALQNNYLKIFQKKYAKLLIDKEVLPGLEVLFFFEIGKRTALYNNSSFTFFGDGSEFTPNNPDRAPVISGDQGFLTHNYNLFDIKLNYQFGRRYDFVNKKLKRLPSALPRVSLLYRRGFGFNDGMPNYNFVRMSFGSKTRIHKVGLFESDIAVGGFYGKEHMEFADYQHFNGVQTAFINYAYDGWTGLRQFSTLPYYDYSTDQTYAEIHLKHRFLGWLLSKPKLIRELNLQSYVGVNYLYVSDVGQYTELFIGAENIFKVLNVQTAMGVDRNGTLRVNVLVGINFDYMFYINATNR